MRQSASQSSCTAETAPEEEIKAEERQANRMNRRLTGRKKASPELLKRETREAELELLACLLHPDLALPCFTRSIVLPSIPPTTRTSSYLEDHHPALRQDISDDPVENTTTDRRHGAVVGSQDRGSRGSRRRQDEFVVAIHQEPVLACDNYVDGWSKLPDQEGGG